MGEEATLDSRMEFMRTEYSRKYRYDVDGHMSRSALREDMLEFLQCEFSDRETLLQSSDLWRVFLKDVVRAPASGPLRISRRRQHSLAAALSRAGDQQAPECAGLGQKRPREEDGAGGAEPCLSLATLVHGSRH